MSPIQSFNKLPTIVKGTIAVAASLLSLVGGVWAIDDRYIDQVEYVASLELYNQKVQQQITEFKKTQNVKELERVTDRYYQLKRMQRMYPDDPELAEELKMIQERRNQMREKLNLQ